MACSLCKPRCHDPKQRVDESAALIVGEAPTASKVTRESAQLRTARARNTKAATVEVPMTRDWR
eukprot:CAMPEP_0115298562 /NCGR_PEP_ID=MMETSP0270-20121206/68325_1 /TAXON_ID=71861 /ORGANISM="Scrippsiella trochoidea, Strain CCMP3099" /LENGTH=63 /DNA_ID=CAMNT_0002716249 /DNA_START=271 /DNA_END=462 /DNA_ORIENTATION=-